MKLKRSREVRMLRIDENFWSVSKKVYYTPFSGNRNKENVVLRKQ